ncbi:MAG: hypothetical protein IJP27_06430 [Clostridia bacterium]|nr:hypothetical protein [Clostridia bacterium]
MKKKLPKTALAAALLGGVALLYLFSYLIINFKGFELFADFDIYADTAYAMEAWKHKSIFPENWVFGNQYYVIATPVVCAFFYGLTGNINLSMILATTLLTVLMLLALWWMLAPFTSRLQQLGAAAVLLGGIITRQVASDHYEGVLFFTMAGYYSCYLLTIFVVIGDYLRAVRDGKPLRLSTLLSCLLMIATGMQSLRQTAVLTLPLIAVELLRLLFLLIQKHRLKKAQLMPTLSVGLYTLSNLIGLVLIKLLDPPSTTIYGDMGLRTAGWAEAIEVNLRVIRRLSGLGYALEEPNGWLFFAVALLINGLAWVGFFLSLRRAIKNRSAEDPVLLTQLILLTAMVALFAANLVIDMNVRSIYFFPWYAFIAVSMGSLLRLPWKTAVAAMLTLACTVNWFAGYRADVAAALKADSTPNVYREIAAYLEETDCRYLYGAWTSTARVAAYTNGQVQAGGYYDGVFHILPYINRQDIYTEDHNKHALYLLGDDGWAAHGLAKAQGATLTKVAEFGQEYTLYSSDKQLMYHKN